MHTRRFSPPNLLQIAMPMGGIGAGCVCLNGHGGFQDFAFRNKPATTAVQDGHGNSQAAFALLHVRAGGDGIAESVTRLVEGPFPPEKIYDQGLQAQGYRHGGHEGFPRFGDAEFVAEYPFGHVHLSDPKVPISAVVTGWSPFIPGDDVSASLPCAIVEYALTNTSLREVSFELSFHLSHPAVGAGGWKGTRTAATAEGVVFTNTDSARRDTFGSAALVVADSAAPTAAVKASWLRSGWFDALGALWKEVSTGAFRPNEGTGARDIDGRNGGSVLVAGTLAPGETRTIPFILAWHFPNVHNAYGSLALPQAGDPAEIAPRWRPFYAGKWADAAAVAAYARENYDSLRARTCAFADALHGSTLPDVVIDAVASNLAILKSPTVLRQENGNVWAWEGCFPDSGCCHGSCTHVWNYAQALPHLFPPLERTLREQELLRSQDERGHVNFRAALPDGPASHNFHPAADGQFGGILKLFRDWRICGDTDWMRRLYPEARRSLEFCIHQWDPDERGGLFEPHHNTYDIEFWGPDGMCGSIYLAALCAMARLAESVDETADRERYESLAAKAAVLLDGGLFNGEYYIQRVQWEGLRDTSFVDYLAKGAEPWDEVYPILRAEGPKYQYGNGCLSDGIIGQWMATLYGVDTPLDRAHVRSHLAAIFRHNFKPDLSEHACTQRPGYAMGKEAGLLVCSWPHGDKPVLPFVYSDEVWTGMEYQVASHLIAEGMVAEGLTLVEAVRARYDGHVRNPFNEYECGSYYARALSSYALLAALSGFRYDAVERRLYLDPRLPERPFRTFFATAAGWGTITLEESGAVSVSLAEGELRVESVVLGDAPPRAWTVTVNAGESATLAP